MQLNAAIGQMKGPQWAINFFSMGPSIGGIGGSVPMSGFSAFIRGALGAVNTGGGFVIKISLAQQIAELQAAIAQNVAAIGNDKDQIADLQGQEADVKAKLSALGIAVP